MSEPATVHVPVLAQEVLQWLDIAPGHVVVDATLGGGGHARLFAQRVGKHGLVVGLDRDPIAVQHRSRELADLPVTVQQANFSELGSVLAGLGHPQVDRILFDLGISSDQLADAQRGFSFDSHGPLDLRMNPLEGEPAWQLLERLPEKELADLIYQFGEERHSRRVARRIVAERRTAPIRTAAQLAELVRRCVPRSRVHRIDPATRTFQALRIAVNDELGELRAALQQVPDCLRPGGRVAVISFHSLEDRMVKFAFRDDPRYSVLTKKPIRANQQEIARNVRSRSAKMRVATRSVGP